MNRKLIDQLQTVVGNSYVTTDPDVLADRSVDYTGRYRGRASALIRPATANQVATVLTMCRGAGVHVTVQGGRTSLVAGTVPEYDDVLLSTDRLTEISEVDAIERRVVVGAGVTLSQIQQAANQHGLIFGVDLTARDSATAGGMASTNAGGLRTVQYGNMANHVLGLDIALPDGSLVKRRSRVYSDNTGYDLAGLFVGAEGTLGVITRLELQLHRAPEYRVTALCRFGSLDALIDTSRIFRDVDEIAALELIDGRCAAMAAQHLNRPTPFTTGWLLLVELTGDSDPTERLAQILTRAGLPEEPAVATDSAAQQRLWRVRESTAEVVTLYGPPLKFDISLPLSSVAPFTSHAGALTKQYSPEAIPLLFGHIGEGNLHLNILRCSTETEPALYRSMMELIAAHDGNVSSEHGVGTRKRSYLTMSRQSADIEAMRTIKRAFDPTGYLNRAVLFDTNPDVDTAQRH